MASESPLLKLPEDAMDNVLHYCDYLEIVRLRKTCRSLRDFVDTAKPDARMDKMEIDCDANKVIFRLRMGEQTIEIVYRKVIDGCHIFNNINRKNLKLDGLDFMEAFENDFTVFLRHQKSVLEEMEIKSCSAYYQIEQVLNALKAHSKNPKTQKFQLKTTKLSLPGLPASQVLLALYSVEPQTLCSLSINEERNVLINDITESEQWKHLNTCFATGFRILDVRRISHLNTFCGFVSIVTAADLAFLKTAFLKSPNFRSCKINCNIIANFSQIAGVQPFISRGSNSGVSKLWFFRMPNDTSRVLSLNVNDIGVIYFGRTATARVPTGAVIIG